LNSFSTTFEVENTLPNWAHSKVLTHKTEIIANFAKNKLKLFIAAISVLGKSSTRKSN